MLHLDNVTLAHGEQIVIEDLNLQLSQGQRLGITGASGVGKTTILQSVAGLLPVRAGTIKNSFERIAYVFQQPRLLPWRSACDNVALPLRNRGMDKSTAQETAVHWLERLSLPNTKWRAYPSALSGGMAQRVSLARAFALQPDLLLLDEPFSALDPVLRRELIALCDQLLTDSHCALLYVCHHPQELYPLTKQNLSLENSHQRQIHSIKTPPLFEEVPL